MLKYVVINSDGSYAGVPCEGYDEALDLANQREGRVIYKIVKEED